MCGFRYTYSKYMFAFYLIFFFLFLTRVSGVLGISASVYCSQVHKLHLSTIFSLKISLTLLFIYLKIILL